MALVLHCINVTIDYTVVKSKELSSVLLSHVCLVTEPNQPIDIDSAY